MEDNYVPVGEALSFEEVVEMYDLINESELVELLSELPDGRLSHIVKKGTDTPKAYITRDNQLELINANPENLELEYEHLMDMYNEVTRDRK